MNGLSPLEVRGVAPTVITVDVLEVGDLWGECGWNLGWPERFFGCGGGGCRGSGGCKDGSGGGCRFSEERANWSV